ncbi:hypothetical protein G6011_11701 [Alternaria panax]|uniref:Uncharacterized protein n=1 Tax=Alternaria panax TaxID=48097 RepID=A0AAD4NS76_9PLEO|nr:hypothetical protein G6011_11701 [Alternaria panax]
MSKRNNDGDVIANRISLLEAKGQKLLASLYGSRPDWDTTINDATKSQDGDDDQDLRQNYAHDRIGLGGILPKDVEDGSFTSRTRTSDDKLLQQLIGKKKAKAHIAAKQEAARPNAAAKAQQYKKAAAAQKKEESDDEEEGRAATFKSKRRRNEEKREVRKVDSDDEDEEMRARRLGGGVANGSVVKVEEGMEKEGTVADAQKEVELAKKEEDDEEAQVTQPAPKKARTKPKSFLDEILAERSKKKSKKAKT